MPNRKHARSQRLQNFQKLLAWGKHKVNLMQPHCMLSLVWYENQDRVSYVPQLFIAGDIYLGLHISYMFDVSNMHVIV